MLYRVKHLNISVVEMSEGPVFPSNGAWCTLD